MRKKHIVVVLALSIASVLTAACGKKVGGSCKGTESTCLDKKTALACRGGTFAEVACAGPMGCSKYEDHANCDTSVASAGDPCLGEDDEYACSPDGKRAVACKGGKFEPWLECRGKAGCTMLGHTVSCDTSIAEVGDTCKTQGAVACGGDQKHMVVCRDGKFALYRQCRGQYGCYNKGETPSCDLTISLAGDPCGIPGQVVCSVDGKSELVCQGGVFTKSITCKTACTVTNRPGRPIDCQ
ncbi:MAG: hypothetical protein BGO98_15550 [Myxococcales bacterium 68-20]|nr:hypothetical protein [Myxococcales bacterium]OJY31468.1 MAG: hypothetical protein BGO98_15550 [Myxococcales bacterium 68-20]